MTKIAIGEAEGSERVEIATKKAINSPLLDNVNLKNAQSLLVNITASSLNYEMSEHVKIHAIISANITDDTELHIGHVADNSMGDKIRVTIIATGFNANGDSLI